MALHRVRVDKNHYWECDRGEIVRRERRAVHAHASGDPIGTDHGLLGVVGSHRRLSFCASHGGGEIWPSSGEYAAYILGSAAGIYLPTRPLGPAAGVGILGKPLEPETPGEQKKRNENRREEKTG